ncbi:MAG: hypothetical protein V4679_14640 [Pseudomonadota bacterium]
MPIIANKLAFYTDSIGNVPGDPSINLAANVCAKLVGVTYDAQQLGGQKMGYAYNGQFSDGSPNWLGGLTMPQHTELIQADTIVLHLGGNDPDSFIQGATTDMSQSPVAYLMALYGQTAAASGRKIAIMQAPVVVEEDVNKDDYSPADIQAWKLRCTNLQVVREAVVAQINSQYPGAAKLIYYRPPVVMDPGTTGDGMHPKPAKHLEIAHAIAASLGAWRGWSVLP